MRQSLHVTAAFLSTCFLMAFACEALAQTEHQKDSALAAMCKVFTSTRNLPDSLRMANLLHKHLEPFAGRFGAANKKELLTNLFFQLQKRCPEFGNAMALRMNRTSDWEILKERPKTLLDDSECRGIRHYKKFYYRQSNDDTVRVDIDNGFWIDHFENGTYSKLKFKWLNDCTMELEFVQSDNLSRKNLSKPGDKYVYEILDKRQNFYWLSVSYSGMGQFMRFKLYYR